VNAYTRLEMKKIAQQKKLYSTWRREWCLRQDAKSIIRLLVTLTFDLLALKLIASCPCLSIISCIYVHQNRFIRLKNIAFRSVVTDKRTKGRTDRWTTRKHNASSCQAGLGRYKKSQKNGLKRSTPQSTYSEWSSELPDINSSASVRGGRRNLLRATSLHNALDLCDPRSVLRDLINGRASLYVLNYFAVFF